MRSRTRWSDGQSRRLFLSLTDHDPVIRRRILVIANTLLCGSSECFACINSVNPDLKSSADVDCPAKILGELHPLPEEAKRKPV